MRGKSREALREDRVGEPVVVLIGLAVDRDHPALTLCQTRVKCGADEPQRAHVKRHAVDRDVELLDPDPADDAAFVPLEQSHKSVEESGGLLALSRRGGRPEPTAERRSLQLLEDPVEPSVPAHCADCGKVGALELDPLVREIREMRLGERHAGDDHNRLPIRIGACERLGVAGLVDVAELHGYASTVGEIAEAARWRPRR